MDPLAAAGQDSDPRATRGADRALHASPATLRADVDRAMALLRPFIEATIADPAVSRDQSLVIVVTDPAAAPQVPIEEAILSRHAFGRAGRVDAEDERHALDKAQASHRERCDTSILRERGSALLTADLPLAGGLHRRGWTLGVAGAVPAFDEAIGACAVEVLHALRALDPATFKEN